MARTKADLEAELDQAKAALATFLERAHNMADRAGHCSEYDRIVAYAAKGIDLPEGWNIVKRNGHYTVARTVRWVIEYEEVIDDVDISHRDDKSAKTAVKVAEEDYYPSYEYLSDRSDEGWIREAINTQLEPALLVFKRFGVDGRVDDGDPEELQERNFSIELEYDLPSEYRVE